MMFGLGLSTPLVYLMAALAIFTVGFGAGFKVEHNAAKANEAEAVAVAVAEYKAEAKRASDSAAALETQKEQANVTYRTITRTVDRIVLRPIYSDRCLDDAGLHAVNDALAGSAATPAQPDGSLPSTPTTR